MKAAGQRRQFAGIYDGKQWLGPSIVATDVGGAIVSVSPAGPGAGPVDERIDGLLIPGFPNGHSHAFQYAMVGQTEFLAAGHAYDDFWSWRDAMYRIAARISPEALQAVATMLYAEMLRCGITQAVEFHYLHNDPSGARYSQVDELAHRLCLAAETSGIELTIVPVYYRAGGFDQPAVPGQKRFLSASVDDYHCLVSTLVGRRKGASVHVGIGVHSLRASPREDTMRILNDLTREFAGPVHLHISEQKKEVADCLAAWGRRPVEWLLESVAVNERFALTHAIHMTPEETKALAASGATMVVCPSTEGNLGDGITPLSRYWSAGGRFTIGTDSHINLDPLQDIRWLDYLQRVVNHKRNTFGHATGAPAAETLMQVLWEGGDFAATGARKVTNASATPPAAPRPILSVGAPLTGVVFDAMAPVLVGKDPAHLLASIVYGADQSAVIGTFVRGRQVVSRGLHHRRDEIARNFIRAMAELRNPES